MTEEAALNTYEIAKLNPEAEEDENDDSDNPGKHEEDEEEEDDHETTCGFGSWRPAWIQGFASARFFAINFALIGILQGTNFSYTIGIISTIEKRYAFESKISG